MTIDLVEGALDRAAVGDETTLAGFGLERITASSPFWEERLAIDGTGRVTLRTRRSIADVSGEAIGAYAFDAGCDAAASVAKQVRAAALLSFSAVHVEPFGVRTIVSIVAGGAAQRVVVGGGPERLAPLGPLLQELDRLAMAARRHPEMTLGLELETAAPLRRGMTEVPVVLRFRNVGNTGYWMTEPSSFPPGLGTDDDAKRMPATEDGVDWRREHCLVWFGFREPETPGVTPLPVEVTRGALAPEDRGLPPLVWMPPRGAIERRFRAAIPLHEAGSLVVRASFASYAGDDTIAGRPRLRGCVFSNDLSSEIG